MTCREKLKLEYPQYVGKAFSGGCCGCPSDSGYAEDPDYCDGGASVHLCTKCWDREVEKEKEE